MLVYVREKIFQIEKLPTMDVAEWCLKRKIEKMEILQKFIESAVLSDCGSKANDPYWMKSYKQLEDFSASSCARSRA